MKLLMALLLFSSTIWATDFPLRSKYPNVKTISTEEVAKEYDNLFIIDARSSFEYQVIHINKAVNNPISDTKNFIPNLFKITKGTKNKIVFYCNGITCGKSYKAAKKAMEFGLTNVYAYDLGIFNFSKAQPKLVTLMGKTPVDNNKLISKDRFKKHLLSATAFKEKCSGDNVVLFDGRDRIQKKQTPDWIKSKALPSPFKGLLKLLKGTGYKKTVSGKTLCFVDQAGKQVRWLQYYLEDLGYTDYYFMKGGMFAFYNK
jgi:rhodanese-related sulfurtransferase